MRFLPREEKFFALFLDQVSYIKQAAALLVEGVKGDAPKLAASAEQIRALENKADEVIHDIFRRLNQTFITPIDAEDIHSLASHLDDVIDGLEDAVHCMVAYRINPVPGPAIMICERLVGCAASLEKAFATLHSDRKLIQYCIEVNRLEEEVDKIVRNAVQDLFDTETDAIRIMKLKEVYDLLEQTVDYCEDVADALENVVVKNS